MGCARAIRLCRGWNRVSCCAFDGSGADSKTRLVVMWAFTLGEVHVHVHFGSKRSPPTLDRPDHPQQPLERNIQIMINTITNGYWGL